MGRKRRKKQNRPPIEAKPEKGALKENGIKKTHAPLETWALSVMHGFMRNNEDVIAVAYRVPTAQIANERSINEYKSRAITALQTLGRQKSLVLSVDKIEFKALPLGDETLIKAFCLRRDAIGQKDGRSVAQRPNNDPFDWSGN